MKPQAVILFLSTLICLLILALIGLVLMPDDLFSKSDDPDTEESVKERRLVTVETIAVRRANSFDISRTYYGTTKASQTVDLGFSRAGRIVELLVEKGAHVKKGDTLAVLDKRRLEIQKTKIDDALEEQEEQSNRSGRPGGSTVTESDADLVDLELEESELKAPFDGIIAVRNVSPGAVTNPGMPVFRIVQKDKLEAWLALPVDAAAELEIDELHELVIGGKSCMAPVTAILPEVDQGARTRTVIFTLNKDDSADHLPGEIVQASLTRTVQSAGFWAPLTALSRQTRGLWSVFSAEVPEDAANDEKARIVTRHFVEVIHVEDEWAWIRGLPENRAEIVAGGVHRVTPGQKVKTNPRSTADSEHPPTQAKIVSQPKEEARQAEAISTGAKSAETKTEAETEPGDATKEKETVLVEGEESITEQPAGENTEP